MHTYHEICKVLCPLGSFLEMRQTTQHSILVDNLGDTHS